MGGDPNPYKVEGNFNPGTQKLTNVITDTSLKLPVEDLTGYEKGKVDNISVVGGNPNPVLAPEDDLPPMDGPLQERASWPADVPEDVFDHRPLTPERYEQIQARLKELTENKVLPARKFREFLETRHGGKRAAASHQNLLDHYTIGRQTDAWMAALNKAFAK